MKNKYEQLLVAVQDLLIELDITPKKLRFLATQPTNSAATSPGSKISPRVAQRLIDADLIVEEIDWRKPVNMENRNDYKKCVLANEINTSLSMFDKIKSNIAPGILWSYLREKHPEFLFNQIKDYLFPVD